LTRVAEERRNDIRRRAYYQPMTSDERFARSVFRIAGIYGLIVLLPQYFMEAQIGRDYPPAITHPEHFYGFVGVALAWQFVFLVIASDARRYRPLMVPAILEKLAFFVPTLWLYANGRVAPVVLAVSSVDVILGALFLAAFLATRQAPPGRA
jgi:purine-cytosine permease-like protein